MIETTINAQTVNYLTEKELAEMIKKQEFKKEYAVQVYNFFTDVPLQDIVRFIINYNIDESVLLKYYITYVKEYYPNKELEAMLEDVV
ncbi:hypothetical protein [Caldicellulosiruptor acetigenus]|uniref:hypothetical protein n=1 Tax=Caldicellulosiruptor acetigenus TaxID=301953 RepID=UPI00042135A4|nr:hypothetical protein [Caldicellulosiruptor acetigenus]WAM36939.1 hypothetical protein OTK01_000745 [Caldicellulosiruptor acetigenus]